jgi:hypothetical protein
VKINGDIWNVGCRDAPDTVLAGYPANIKDGYRISGQISGIPDIRLNIQNNRKI